MLLHRLRSYQWHVIYRCRPFLVCLVVVLDLVFSQLVVLLQLLEVACLANRMRPASQAREQEELYLASAGVAGCSERQIDVVSLDVVASLCGAEAFIVQRRQLIPHLTEAEDGLFVDQRGQFVDQHQGMLVCRELRPPVVVMELFILITVQEDALLAIDGWVWLVLLIETDDLVESNHVVAPIAGG